MLIVEPSGGLGTCLLKCECPLVFPSLGNPNPPRNRLERRIKCEFGHIIDLVTAILALLRLYQTQNGLPGIHAEKFRGYFLQKARLKIV